VLKQPNVKVTTVTKHHTVISAHIIATSDLIHATARDTVRATPSAREDLAHIDATQSFITAAEALYEAAERIAAGAGAGCERLSLALRIAEHKATEGRWRLNGF
jgi:hypothetical protein